MILKLRPPWDIEPVPPLPLTRLRLIVKRLLPLATAPAMLTEFTFDTAPDAAVAMSFGDFEETPLSELPPPHAAIATDRRTEQRATTKERLNMRTSVPACSAERRVRIATRRCASRSCARPMPRGEL